MNDYGAPAEWITCVRMVIAAVFFLFLTAVRDWRDLVAVKPATAARQRSRCSPSSALLTQTEPPERQ